MRVRPTWVGLVSLQEKAREAACPFLATWKPNKKSAICSPEEDPLQSLTMLAPLSGAYNPQNYEKHISFVETSSSWLYFVMAAQAKTSCFL